LPLHQLLCILLYIDRLGYACLYFVTLVYTKLSW
jgi:hypothetical protein